MCQQVFGGNTRNSKLGANAIRSEARPAANQQVCALFVT